MSARHERKHASISSTLSVLLAFGLSACGSTEKTSEDQARLLPLVDREFRAAWVATVANIDWPTSPGLSTAEQQMEARAILDTAARLGLNALVLQVRPQCDAFYKSSLEPWSGFLSGTEGRPPDPYHDPLEFWIVEAHRRGIELHAWFNPYRARVATGSELTDLSIARTRPEIAKKLPNGYYWLDPAKQATQDHSYDVVMDVVRRYDIDGVHFDDYFYPYGDGSFPDDDTWNEYVEGGGKASREDWRRQAVNTFVKRVYTGIHKEKPHIKFGLSPFGIWRPGNPPSIAGFDQYAILYADARLWLNEGWIDYWTPQLYWPINQIPQSFPVLLGWWTSENRRHRHLWPGLFTSRMTDDRGVDEVFNQIMVTRGFVPDAPGHIHFSMKALMGDTTMLRETLREGPYRRQALVPASPWLDSRPPEPPALAFTMISDSVRLTWSHPDPSDVFRWVAFCRYEGRWDYRILNRDDWVLTLPLSRPAPPPVRADSTTSLPPELLQEVALAAVDRSGNESLPVFRQVGGPGQGE